MTESRTSKIDELRARIEREDYVVDPAALAGAILARLLVGRSARDAGR